MSSPTQARATPTRRAATNAQTRLHKYFRRPIQRDMQVSPQSPDVVALDTMDDQGRWITRMGSITPPRPTPAKDVALREGKRTRDVAKVVATRAKKGEPLASGWAIAGFLVDKKYAMVDGVQDVDTINARCVFCDASLVVKATGRTQVSWATCGQHLNPNTAFMGKRSCIGS